MNVSPAGHLLLCKIQRCSQLGMQQSTVEAGNSALLLIRLREAPTLRLSLHLTA